MATVVNNSPVAGYKVDDTYEEVTLADGSKEQQVVPHSTLANRAAEENPGHNPDFFPSTGESKEANDAVGKGANPSADVVTKQGTTIDPVKGRPSPTADGVVVPFEVPAVLPEGSPVSEKDGSVHAVGEAPLAFNNAATSV